MPGLCQVMSSNESLVMISSLEPNFMKGARKGRIFFIDTNKEFEIYEEFEDSDFVVTTYLHEEFIKRLPQVPQIECVYWAFEGPLLRVWTALEKPNDAVQGQIYESELLFMDNFPEIECDFVIIFCPREKIEDMVPYGAHRVFPR